MSPDTRPSFRAGRTMITAAVVIIIALVVLWAVSVWLTKRHNDRLATDSGGVVELGSTSRLADRFERDGGTPIYFPDVSGSAERSVYLVHDGGSPAEGWTAFLAQVPGEAASCQWEWNPDTTVFDASCDPDLHADADGTGLVAYPVTVVEGKLRVDLRSRIPSAVPTSRPATGDG